MRKYAVVASVWAENLRFSPRAGPIYYPAIAETKGEHERQRQRQGRGGMEEASN